jgi:hypothetical protein
MEGHDTKDRLFATSHPISWRFIRVFLSLSSSFLSYLRIIMNSVPLEATRRRFYFDNLNRSYTHNRCAKFWSESDSNATVGMKWPMTTIELLQFIPASGLFWPASCSPLMYGLLLDAGKMVKTVVCDSGKKRVCEVFQIATSLGKTCL